jgi:hypothetical protein
MRNIQPLLPYPHPHLHMVQPVPTSEALGTESQQYNCSNRRGVNAMSPMKASPEG